ncbi:diguanylate cyclase (GGDEF) domain-containing protein [Lachnospiraceae bacterium A10]|nr:diguanylate cyclase (GGDEF) domain-containing protein [Lachnospiraceae bacterium A10]
MAGHIYRRWDFDYDESVCNKWFDGFEVILTYKGKVMKIKKNLITAAYTIVVFVALFLYLGTVLIQKYPFTIHALYDPDDLIDLADAWDDEAGQHVDLEDLNNLPDENGDGVTSIYAEIPQDIEEKTELGFSCGNIYLKMYIEDELIYELEPENIHAVGKSYGTTYESISIAPMHAGKTMRLDIDCIYDDSARILDMYLGGSGNYLMYFMTEHFSAYLMSTVLLIVGLVFSVLCFTIPQDKNLRGGLVNFAMLAILIGVWSIEETKVPLVLTGNADFWRALDYPILMMLPYFFVAAVNGLLMKPKRIYSIIILSEFLISTSIILGGWLFFDKDFHELEMVIHFGVALAMVMVVFMIVYDRREMIKEAEERQTKRKEHGEENRVSTIPALLWGITIFAGCAVFDMIRYYVSDGAVSDAVSTIRIGFMIFEFAMFYRYIISAIQNMRTNTANELYQKLVYTDSLTGIKNRAAYLADHEEWEYAVSRMQRTKTTVVSFDINYLSHMNHAYGRMIGDQYIIESAKLISRCFSHIGEVYRIGDDEFRAYVPGNDSEERVKEALIKLDGLEKSFDVGLPEPFSLAYGYAVFDSTNENGSDFEVIEELSDRRMKECKIRMKKKKEYGFARI